MLKPYNDIRGGKASHLRMPLDGVFAGDNPKFTAVLIVVERNQDQDLIRHCRYSTIILIKLWKRIFGSQVGVEELQRPRPRIGSLWLDNVRWKKAHKRGLIICPALSQLLSTHLINHDHFSIGMSIVVTVLDRSDFWLANQNP